MNDETRTWTHYPIPGEASLQYRSEGRTWKRCSRCHAAQPDSALALLTPTNSTFQPIMVGSDLVGILCAACVAPVEMSIQLTFPDGHAFPFVDSRGELLETPRCDQGHPLVFAPDGRSMVCPKEDEHAAEPAVRDLTPAELVSVLDPKCPGCSQSSGLHDPDCVWLMATLEE